MSESRIGPYLGPYFKGSCVKNVSAKSKLEKVDELIDQKEYFEEKKVGQELTEVQEALPALGQDHKIVKKKYAHERLKNKFLKSLAFVKLDRHQRKIDKNIELLRSYNQKIDELHTEVNAKEKDILIKEALINEQEANTLELKSDIETINLKIKNTTNELNAKKKVYELNKNDEQRVNEEIKTLRTKYESFLERVGNTNKSLEWQKSFLKNKNSEMNEMSTQIETVDHQVIELQSKIEAKRHDVSKVQKEIDELTKNLNESKKKLEVKEREFDHKDKDLQRAQNQLSLKKDYLQDIIEKENTLRANIINSENQLKSSEEETQNLELEIKKINFQIKDNEQIYENILINIATSKSEVSEQRIRYESVKEKNEIALNNVESMKSKLKSVEENIEQYITEIKEVESKRSHAIKSSQEYRKEVSDLQNNVVNLKETLNDTHEKTEETESENIILRDRMDDLAQSISQMTKTKNKSEKKLLQLEQEVRNNEEKLSMSGSKLTELTQVKNEYVQKVHSSENNLNIIKQDIEFCMTAIKEQEKLKIKLIQEFDGASKEYELNHQKNKNFKAELEILAEALNAVQKQIREKGKKLTTLSQEKSKIDEDILKIKKLIKDSESKREDLDLRIAEENSLIKKMKVELERNECIFTKRGEDLAALNISLRELRDELQFLNGQKDEFSQKLIDCEFELKNAEDEISSLQQSIEDNKIAISDNERHLLRKEGAFKSKMSEKSLLEVRLQTILDQVNGLKESEGSVNRNVEILDNELSSLLQKIESKTNELQAKRQDVQQKANGKLKTIESLEEKRKDLDHVENKLKMVESDVLIQTSAMSSLDKQMDRYSEKLELKEKKIEGLKLELETLQINNEQKRKNVEALKQRDRESNKELEILISESMKNKFNNSLPPLPGSVGRSEEKENNLEYIKFKKETLMKYRNVRFLSGNQKYKEGLLENREGVTEFLNLLLDYADKIEDVVIRPSHHHPMIYFVIKMEGDQKFLSGEFRKNVKNIESKLKFDCSKIRVNGQKVLGVATIGKKLVENELSPS
jgi:chromosome segregation ATPase